MKPSLPRPWLPVTVLLSLAVGCDAPTGPSPAALAGTYRLEVVNGRPVPDTVGSIRVSGTVDATIVLSANGGASRRVSYRDRQGVVVPFAASGTFEVRGNALELTLREMADYTWRVRGEMSGGVLTLRYPAPGDGEIIEAYRRQ